MPRLIFCLILLAAAVSPLRAAEPVPERVEGAALVIDGDTVHIGDHKIRLGGIDAPELKTRPGLYARAALEELIAGRDLTCEIIEPRRDRYGRLIGRCDAGSGDLAEAMVRAGAAWTLRQYIGDRYDAAEAAARAACAGVWSAWEGCD